LVRSSSAARCGGTWDLDPVKFSSFRIFFSWIFFLRDWSLRTGSPPSPKVQFHSASSSAVLITPNGAEPPGSRRIERTGGKKKKMTTCIRQNRNARTNSRACWRLTETSARPSDARIATAVSLLIGVFFSCALFLQISRTLVELHWARERRHHNLAPSCSSAPQELSLRALDLPA